MRVLIRRMGNSAAVILPTSILAEVGVGIGDEFSLAVEKGGLVLVPTKPDPRAVWADAARLVAAIGDDDLVWPEFGNVGDDRLGW